MITQRHNPAYRPADLNPGILVLGFLFFCPFIMAIIKGFEKPATDSFYCILWYTEKLPAVFQLLAVLILYMSSI